MKVGLLYSKSGSHIVSAAVMSLPKVFVGCGIAHYLAQLSVSCSFVTFVFTYKVGGAQPVLASYRALSEVG